MTKCGNTTLKPVTTGHMMPAMSSVVSYGARGRRWLSTIMLFTALFGCGATSSARAQEIIWRMATIAPETSPLFRNYATYFAEKVRLWSSGRLVIEPRPVGELAHPFKLYEAVREGQVDIAWTHPGFLAIDDPVNALFSGFPGGMEPEVFLHWAYMGGGQGLWQDYRRRQMNLMSFYLGQTTADVFAHSHRPVRKASDLNGYRQVTTGPWAEILEGKFGGVASVAPSGDILDWLRRRQVDGVEYGGAGANLALGFHRVARYVILPGVQQPGTATEVILSADTFDALPPDLQQILRDAARATTFHVWTTLGHGDLEAMATYQRLGNIVVVMDPSLQNAIRGAGQTWMKSKMAARLKKGDKQAYALYKSYVEFQAHWAETDGLRRWTRAAQQ